MEKIYFDNAATTFPKPPNVMEAVFDILNSGSGTPGRGLHASAMKATGDVGLVRQKISKFFGLLEDFRVIFTYSATDALNLAIKGFLNAGDHVVISSMEHNSVSRPLMGMRKNGFIELSIVNADIKGYIDLSDLKQKLTNKTKLVVINHASNVTGAVQPVDEITKVIRNNSNAFFLLDAAQTAGRIPINVISQNIDFLAFAGHKGLFGLQGTGGLILGERVRHLRPFREGGTGFDSQSECQPVVWPEAFEAGTHNVPGIISMGAGIDFINETGMERIASKELQLLKVLWEGLGEYVNVTLYGPEPAEDRVSVFSFNVEGWEPVDIGEILNQNHQIQVRTGLECAPLAHKSIGTYPMGTVRVSPGYFNSMDDASAFLKAIDFIASAEVPLF